MPTPRLLRRFAPPSLVVPCLLWLAGGLPSLVHAADPVLVWSDEFNQADGSAPDDTKWGYDVGGGGWGNNELETYTNSRENSYIASDPEAIDGKVLVIRAKSSGTGSYTSARLLTANKFTTKYGRVEARLKVPVGKGMWPAFWALGADINSGVAWPACGEIDIMEWVGQTPNTVYGSLHGPSFYGANPLTKTYQLPGTATFSDAYHVFAVDWYPGVISFSVDGVVYQTRKKADQATNAVWPFEHTFFLIMNLAVGGNWPGSPDANTKFPQEYRIDYVRVYSIPSVPPSSGTFGPTAPASVGGLPLDPTHVRVSWLPSVTGFGTAVTGFTLERATDSGFTQGLVSWDVGLTYGYLDTSAVSGASYFYRVTARNVNGTSDPAVSAKVTVPGSVVAGTNSLINVSTRAWVGTGQNVAVGGFVVAGNAPKNVVVRAAGPTLGVFGIVGFLKDPMVKLYDGANNVIAVNDDWGQGPDAADLPAAFGSVGAFQFGAGSKDAALTATLPPGNYTAEVSGANGTSGIALVEVYEVPTGK